MKYLNTTVFSMKSFLNLLQVWRGGLEEQAVDAASREHRDLQVTTAVQPQRKLHSAGTATLVLS